MQSIKSLARVANDSEICRIFMNKHLFVLISLLKEPQGLRVSDIHKILEGNKSWICNILLKLEKLNLTTRVKYDDKREVYYRLTEKGEQVARNGLLLTQELLDQETYKIITEYDDVHIIFKSDLINKDFRKRRMSYRNKIRHLPLHKYVGKLTIYNNFLTFNGENPIQKKFFFFKLDFDNIKKIALDYDDVYKGRFGSLFSKPVKIEFEKSNSIPDILYVFADWSRSFKIARKNKDFYDLLTQLT
ncbi:MAG: winged helix DNA-binding protein [Candidatus Helarchaeales archaeon]